MRKIRLIKTIEVGDTCDGCEHNKYKSTKLCAFCRVFNRPENTAYPRCKAATVGAGECIHPRGFDHTLQVMVEGDEVIPIQNEVDRFTYCPDCGAKLGEDE